MKKLESYAYINDIIASVSQQFPKKCNCCGVVFEGFSDFINKTTIPEHNNSRNVQLIRCDENDEEEGYILAYRDCACRSSIAILCALEDELKAKMFQTIEEDAKALGVSMEAVMELIRNRIIASV